MLNRVNRGDENNEKFYLSYIKSCRVYKCTAFLHTPMGRTHGENSMSKLDKGGKYIQDIKNILYEKVSGI